jgi:hypothetical protein
MTHFLSLTVSWSVLVIEVLTVLVWSTLGAEATQAGATPTSPEATKLAQERQLNGVLVPGFDGAVIWTGAEIVISDGMHSLAMNPEKNTWRRLAANPAAKGVAQPKLLVFGDGKVLAVYWSGEHDLELPVVKGVTYPQWPAGTKVRLCFDLYDTKADAWRRLAALDRADFKDSRGEPIEDFTWTPEADIKVTSFPLSIVGLVPVPGGAVVFIFPNSAYGTNMGFQVLESGRVSRISQKDAPPHGARDVAVYSRGAQVLYYFYAMVDHNEWAVWDQGTDTWSKSQSIGRRYSFGSCSSGDEVYIFGGAESSAFGWIKRDGAIYSFKDNKWRDMPMENGPHGRRDFTMCWTGKEVLVWGGQTLGEVAPGREVGAANAPWNAVFAFSPTEGKWRVLTGKDAPPARAYSQSVWTGKEMIIVGGQAPWPGGYTLLDKGIYAFDPNECRWRRLPDLPVEEAATRPPKAAPVAPPK